MHWSCCMHVYRRTHTYIHTFIHNPFSVYRRARTNAFMCQINMHPHTHMRFETTRVARSETDASLWFIAASQVVVLYQEAGVEDFKEASGRFLWQPPLEMWYFVLISLSLMSLLRDSKGKPVMPASPDRRLANSLLLCRRTIADFFLSLDFYGGCLLFVLVDWYLNLRH